MVRIQDNGQSSQEAKEEREPSNCELADIFFAPKVSIQQVLRRSVVTTEERVRELLESRGAHEIARELLDAYKQIPPEGLNAPGMITGVAHRVLYLEPLGLVPEAYQERTEHPATADFFRNLLNLGLSEAEIVGQLFDESSGIRFALASPALKL